mmetsp:Transcript_14131/g.47493  ORF Transcript_14131/g.47493 Transcript_14131/m.47493 type:complete len:86 (+) Transcript_14131:870-1127(+)
MLQAGSHEMTRDHTKLHEITRDCRDYAIVLQVELANAPARKLYEAAGYGTVFADEGASALRVTPGGAELQLKSVPSTLLLMGKGV